MAEILVKGPDGSTNKFPEGTSDDVIKSVMAKTYGAPQAPEAPSEPSPAAPLTPDQGLGFAEGLKRPVDNAAVWIEQGLEGAGIPVKKITKSLGGTTAEEAQAATRADVAKAATEGRRPGTVGNIAGNIISGIPIALATRNPMLAGAAQAGLSSDARNPTDLAKDAAIGGVVGKAGDAITRGIGAAVAPRVRAAVALLRKEGVPLTPGQIFGGGAQKFEDAVSSIPLIGDVISNAQARGIEGFNKAAVNRTLAPIGEILPKGVAAGHDAVDHAQQAIGKAYDTLLPQVKAQLDAQFGTDIRTLHGLAANMPTDQQKIFTNLIRTEVAPIFNPQTGTASGEAFKRAEETLGKRARHYRTGNATPHDRDLSDAIGEVQHSLRELLARQNPAQAARLRSINSAYGELLRVEDAAAKATAGNGIFTPKELRSTAIKSKFASTKQAARGDARSQDLARAGIDTLSPKVANSGTATRAAVTGLGGAALFGGATPFMSINPLALGGFAAALAPYASKRAQNALATILTARPKAASAAVVRRGLERVAPRVGQGAVAANSAQRNKKD